MTVSQTQNTLKTIAQAASFAACLVFLPIASASAQDMGATMSGGSVGDPSYQANLEIRLNSMENQIRDLTGKVEQQEFTINQLRDQLQKTLADNELRFRDLESKSNAAVPGAVPPQPGNTSNTIDPIAGPVSQMEPSSSPAIGADEMGAAAVPGMPRALQTPVGLNPTGDITSPAPANAPTQQTLGQVSQDAVKPPVATGNAADDYEAAFSQLKNGNYASAQSGFNQFLKAYPDHPLGPNAIYWMAETYYAQKKYDQSARIFAESFKKYPKGPKAADSLLKLGLSLGESGKTQDACVTLKQIKKQFPTGEGSVIRRTDQELKRLGCAA